MNVMTLMNFPEQMQVDILRQYPELIPIIPVIFRDYGQD
jgi:hypothetical protein